MRTREDVPAEERHHYDAAAVSEGHCPRCHHRLDPTPERAMPALARPLFAHDAAPLAAHGWCPTCRHAYGTGGEGEALWFNEIWSSTDFQPMETADARP